MVILRFLLVKEQWLCNYINEKCNRKNELFTILFFSGSFERHHVYLLGNWLAVLNTLHEEHMFCMSHQ